MTRIIAISDIHGNLAALNTVLSCIQGTPDMLVVTGDLVGIGPQPLEVLDLLRSTRCVVVRGNLDDYVANPGTINRLVRYSQQELNSGRPFRPLLPLEVISQSVEWTRQLLGEQATYLANLPFSICIEASPGRKALFVHANPQDFERPIVQKMSNSQLREMIGEAKYDLIVFGHSHSPFIRRVDDTWFVDVASLGFPTDGNAETTYTEIIFDNNAWNITQHRVAYDVEATAAAIKASGMPNRDVIMTLLKTARRVRAR